MLQCSRVKLCQLKEPLSPKVRSKFKRLWGQAVNINKAEIEGWRSRQGTKDIEPWMSHQNNLDVILIGMESQSSISSR